MKIFLIAGEESGDILGADLMTSLKNNYKDHDFIFRGIGGSRMEALGLSSLFPMQELSLMGIAEILPKVPHLLKRIRQAADAIETFQPDIILTIDAPDFSFRVAKQIQKRGLQIPFKCHYVAPTVWAWRPGRAKKVANLYDGILCLFPFEPPYFEAEGMNAQFVGHPMSELLKDIDEKSFNQKHKISDISKICMLFGSREGEIKRMAPIFIEAAQDLLKQDEEIKFICPTLPHLEETVIELTKPIKDHCLIISNSNEKYAAMKACDAAIATSGTVGLELSVLNVPHVIGYKVNALTHQIGKRMITTKYAHLSNIILQEEVVPEFIQDDCISENISKSILEILDGDTPESVQIDAFEKVRSQIKGPENSSPSDVAANFLMQNFKS